jgi:hypothetical protein
MMPDMDQDMDQGMGTELVLAQLGLEKESVVQGSL